MNQNISTAVMQRRVEPHHSLDDYPTPPWATRALCEWLTGLGYTLQHDTVREPAANRGHMVRPLREYFAQVEASDVHDYGAGFPVQDYVGMLSPPEVDWTITNPPFRLGEDFARRAIGTSTTGCALIVRSAFTEGVGRHRYLFDLYPPRAILQFTERVPMNRGRMEANMTTATAYCWIVWTAGWSGRTEFHWIAPCRKRLERADDYLTEVQ